MPALTFPPFPDNVPTHPLLVVDYERIKTGDEVEVDRLWEAATKLGFWYLKNHGVDKEVNDMFNMGAETMQLPLEEKMKYDQGDTGFSFGYKASGSNAVNSAGERDTVEFINVSRDDALAWPSIAHREYPSTVRDHMEGTVVPFVKKSVEINSTFLSVLSKKLGLPPDALSKRHRDDEYSGSESRCIKSPPNQVSSKVALGAHTDFGSLSFLHNRLGGLQVLVPGAEDWQYVKPLPGHAICNLGDAMSIFSGGILRSNLHRIVPPPGEQGKFERWSVVFFTRPGNSVPLAPLVNESPLIARAVSEAPQGKYQTGATAAEWFARRVKYQKMNNRKGPESWMASRGMEHEVEAT